MGTGEETAILTRGKLDALREIQRLLQRRGIPSELRRPGDGCGSG